MLAGVGDFFDAGHAPFAGGGDDLEIGGERADGDIEPDLVVAFSGAAMGDGGRALLPRGLDHEAGY